MKAIAPQSPAIKPSDDLFDKIISSIKLEKEFAKAKKWMMACLVLLLAAIAVFPFSSMLFVTQWEESGVSYFISAALGNMEIFFALWQDFLLSIFESLPIVPMLLSAINITLILILARFFIYRKGLLARFFQRRFA